MIGEVVASVATATGFILILKAWIKHHRFRQIINKIPGSDGFPVIGDSLKLKTDSLEFFYQAHDFCRANPDGGIAKFWLGTEPFIMVYRPHTVETFLNSTKHAVKGFMYRFLSPWLGDGLLLSYGQKWLERRRLITPTFHFKILEQFVSVFNQQIATLIRIIDEKSAGGAAFNFEPLMALCTLDAICETAMGVKVNAQIDSGSDYVKSMFRLTDSVITRMKYPWMWPEPLFRLTSCGRDDTKCLGVVHDFSRKVIADRIKERSNIQQQQQQQPEQSSSDAGEDSGIYAMSSSKRRRLAFVDMLLSDTSLSPDDVQEEVDTFMFEGHDTTASGSVWIMYMLACFPELQVKVQEEVDSVLGTSFRDVTTDDATKLRYTECFIKESLRLYPPVPWYSRVTTETCKIGGYEIPPNVSVVMSAFHLHRDPEQFPDPEKFDPDRWMTKEPRHPFSYIPFSAGMRNCIGQRFAMLELKVLMCHLMYNFTIVGSFKREDFIPYATLILKSNEPKPVQFVRRHGQ